MKKILNHKSSQQACLASHLAKLDCSEEKMMTETSGQKLLELSKSQDPLGLLERTFLGLLNSISIPFSKTWKAKTTPQGALIFQLSVSASNTKGKEFSLWPTPTKGMHKQDVNDNGEYAKRVKDSGFQVMLPAFVKLYPTLSAREDKYALKGDTQRSNCLEAKARRAGGRLNPTFCEALMGFPLNWTKIEPTE